MRKNFLIFSCFIFMILILNGCSIEGLKPLSKEEISQIKQKVEASKLIVLDVYHNHCESCKYIEPQLEKLKVIYSRTNDVVFLKYDLSNPFSVANSRAIAKELGLENIYKAQRFSGVVIFIDSKTKEILDTLVAEYDASKYVAAIDKHLVKK